MKLRRRSTDAICERIRELRREFRYPDGRKMSQEALAECLGVDPTFISKLENGKLSNLNIDVLLEIAEVFGVTVNDLCYESEETMPEPAAALLRDIGDAGEILRRLTTDQRTMVMNMLRAAV